jgi:hypothetical protein
MTDPSRMLLGRVRPDGSRSVTVIDGRGLRLCGELGPDPVGPDSGAPRITPADAVQIAALASRAPSVHNTQPWRFHTNAGSIEVLADRSRQLRQADRDGREMLISCGAALFGVRLGLRRLGYVTAVDLLPDPSRPELVGRVRPAGTARLTRHESELLAAVPFRHTHRGPFSGGDVSPRLVAALLMDAEAEHAELTVVESAAQLAALIDLATASAADQAGDSRITDDLRAWTRPPGSTADDGITVSMVAVAGPGAAVGDEDLRRWLPQRQFGLPGTQGPYGHAPSVTAVLSTAADTRLDWIRAGQALHRMLLHAATRWVFANLQSEPLESARWRAELRDRLGLPGFPQLLLQLGRANRGVVAARRPVRDLGLPDEAGSDLADDSSASASNRGILHPGSGSEVDLR